MDPIDVRTPAGATFTVIGDAEADYYMDLAERYQKDNHFVNVSDLQDLDRLILMEVLVYRWANWLSQDVDYWGGQPDQEEIKKAINDMSKEIRLLKASMGVDKKTRDKERGESGVEYWENLKRRALEFGVHRNNQLTQTITLFQELKALLIHHDNCTPDERREQNVEAEDVMQWVREIAIPEFDAVDEHFRQNQQRFWVRDI